MSPLFNRLRIARVLLGLFIMAPAIVHADDRPEAYAHAIPVSVSGKQAVVQLPLPRAVYLDARSADLRDLRLFDATGTPLPFALVDQAPQAQESRSVRPVAIFPIRGPARTTHLQDRLEIRTGENGAVISVTPSAKRNADDVLLSLVLDLASAAPSAAKVTALMLTLPPETANYRAELALDISDDLQEWEELAVGSVSWLANREGGSVRKDRITFAPRKFRFARLRWLDGTPIEFAGIGAELVARQHAPLRWESIVLQPAPSGTGADLVYATPIAVPVQAVGLELRGENTVLPVLIGHYRNLRDRVPAGNAPMRLQPMVNTTFFRLTQNGRQRVSGDVDVPLTHASQWVVRANTSVMEPPGLRLRWKPASMVFVAGGKAPYTLAFGRDGVHSMQVPLSQVAPGFSSSELAALELARTGESLQQGAHPGGAGSGAQDGSNMRVLGLWALLLAGVAALAMMAWKLSRQMKEDAMGPPAP